MFVFQQAAEAEHAAGFQLSRKEAGGDGGDGIRAAG